MVCNSEMPYERALLSAYRAVCHFLGIVPSSFRFRVFMIDDGCCDGSSALLGRGVHRLGFVRGRVQR